MLPESLQAIERVGLGAVYLVLAAGILLRDRYRLWSLVRDGFRASYAELAVPGDAGPRATLAGNG